MTKEVVTKFKWAISFIRAWPFENKIRIANLLISNKKKSTPSFEGVVVTNDDFLFHVNTNSFIEYSVFVLGQYEKDVASLIKSFLRDGHIALDVGANVGIHTLLMAKCVGQSGKVIAFEPIKSIRERLSLNIELNQYSNVIVDSRALSDKKENREIYFDSNRNNQGMFSLTWEHKNSNQSIEIDVGDSVVDQYRLERIDFIKMDVEGYELLALKGLKRSIEKFKPILVFEFTYDYIGSQNKELQNEIRGMLSDLQYSTYIINNFGLKHVDLSEIQEGTFDIFCLPSVR